MRLTGANYEAMCQNFVWDIPRHFNIAEAVCDRHVGADRVALIAEAMDGRVSSFTFEKLAELSARLANALAALDVRRGDRVGILLPQCPETLIAHLAAYRLGAVALPLFTLFGPEAIAYRLADSGARVVISNGAGIEKLLALDLDLMLISTDDPPEARVHRWSGLIEAAGSQHQRVATLADDAALLIYTSGTTGQPKGALHAHRVLLGHLPGVEMPHEFFPQPGDRMWTPADWAWAGGLLDVLLPSLFYGVPVLAKRFSKFDPEEAFALLARHDIRNSFMPPTALKLMRDVARPGSRGGVRMRSIASGGERLGEEMLDWGRETFGLTINEFYGQTEANLTISSCAAIMPPLPGAMGRPVPGHIVDVVDDEGHVLPPGATGIIAVRAPDPVMFLGYWNKPEATAAKFRRDWLLTGDTGHRDEDGNFWFHGRDDDIISSGGYRIGPTEIEDCLARHEAVAMVAVVGVPDAVRGEVVKAFVVPREGVVPDDGLRAELQVYVKARLSAHEYPRQIEFRDSLPMTITGKIRRKDLRDETEGR
jgi:acetyl-CoA synthetase